MALYLEHCLRRAEAGEPLKEAHYYAMEAIRMTWWLPDKRRKRALAALEAILTRAQQKLQGRHD